MIDLHIHTTYSDGTNTVQEILKMAEELKLDAISITDHDTCMAYEELKQIHAEKIFTGIIIPGVEMKCCYQGRVVEILGYKINTAQMNLWLKNFYRDKSFDILQQKYFEHFYKTSIQMGLKMNAKESIAWNPQKDWASITIYQEIKKHPENQKKLPEDLWEDVNVFLKKYCGDKNFPLYIDKSNDYPSIGEAINAIRSAGGYVFLPHLYLYKWITDKKIYIKKLMNEYGIDGVEAYYTTFIEEETKEILDFCKQEKLYISGGSDYHGEHKKGINLATGKGNLKIEKDIIKSWL